jgi:hypothetical protein
MHLLNQLSMMTASAAHPRAHSESCLEVSFAEEIQSLRFVRNATRVNKP